MLQAFLEDIKADLEDDTPRRILADYLADHGDLRGDYIAVQCELARLPSEDPRRPRLQQQERELLELHQADWLGRLPLLARHCTFHRGLIRLVLDQTILERRTQAQLLAEPALAWVEQVRFAAAPHHFYGLGQALQRLGFVGLDLSGTSGLALGLLGWPPLPDLNRLNLASNQLDAVGLASVLGNLTLPSLRSLILADNQLDRRGTARLVEFPLVRTITHLDLSGNRLEGEGVRPIVEDAPTSAGMLELRLAGNQIQADGAAALASSPYLRLLRQLDLSLNQLGDRGVAILAQAEHFQHLEMLDLSGNGVGREGIEALLASPWMPRLRQLRLGNHSFDPFDVKSISGNGSCFEPNRQTPRRFEGPIRTNRRLFLVNCYRFAATAPIRVQWIETLAPDRPPCALAARTLFLAAAEGRPCPGLSLCDRRLHDDQRYGPPLPQIIDLNGEDRPPRVGGWPLRLLLWSADRHPCEQTGDPGADQGTSAARLGAGLFPPG